MQYVQVDKVANDAEWREEFEDLGYSTDMWVAVGDFDYIWKDDVEAVEVLEDETYGFMCGNVIDRRCYGFAVNVHKTADGKCWITEADFEEIG